MYEKDDYSGAYGGYGGQVQPKYKWDELFDQNESALYYYNNWTGEVLWSN